MHVLDNQSTNQTKLREKYQSFNYLQTSLFMHGTGVNVTEHKTGEQRDRHTEVEIETEAETDTKRETKAQRKTDSNRG